MTKRKLDSKKKPAPRWIKILAPIAILVIVALPFFFTNRPFALTRHPGWNPTQVQVIGTRVATVGAKESGTLSPGTIYYRAEAEVQYEVDSKKYDVWLPASRVTNDRAELGMWLSDKKGRFATVLWNRENPGEGEVKLKSDIGSYFPEFD